MCGICGLIGKEIGRSEIDIVKRMNDVQSHRGPDDEGLFYHANIVLGHRRLSILDLSPAGHQPMKYMDKYVICYNGEVYNYLELKEELLGEGYTFQSNTDTEVIMASYDKWGPDCFKRFNGFWALALYELETGRTILSRDRFGVKPLHYTVVEDQLLFSSEIKAILSDNRVKRKANKNVILDYLITGIVDFCDETFFENILKLPAGSYMIIDKNIIDRKVIKFYDIKFSDSLQGKATEEQIRKFKELFDSSIRLRLRSDVPVGSCLSGGLDSSSIVCHVNQELTKQQMGHIQETFSACYHGYKFDEKHYIDKVVEATSVKPNYVYPSFDGFHEEFDQLVYTQEEPFGSTSIYASYCVMKEARRRNVPVLLDGQGADELLCGYRKSRIYYIKKLIKNRKLIRAAKELMLSASQVKTSQSIKNELIKIKLILFRNNDARSSRKYLTSQYKEVPLQYTYHNANNFLYNDMTKISLPSLLRYADRNSMAFSIEDRLPFLDFQFADYVAGLSLSVKLSGGYSKYIMREALTMPEEIRRRKDKIGFATPENEWLIKYSDEFYQLFASKEFRAKDYINNQMIVDNWDRILKGAEDIKIFRYICLEKWMRIFEVTS